MLLSKVLFAIAKLFAAAPVVADTTVIKAVMRTCRSDKSGVPR